MSISEKSKIQIDTLVADSHANEELVNIVQHLVEKYWNAKEEQAVFKIRLVEDCFYFSYQRYSNWEFHDFLDKTITYYEKRGWSVTKKGFFSKSLNFKRA